jgi:S-(hydroxymethyl)glutathione dehydrogenase/alcohol dehydrogenase
LNTAEVEAGSSVAVIGCGGVGLSAIQGAKVAGASTIIAIDLSQEKLDLAQSFGATHGLIADDDLFGNVKGLTGGKGVDYAFEIIGFSKTMELAYNLTRNGGVTTLVGIGKHKDRMSFSALAFPVKAKKLCGCMYGSANPPVDFPRMLELYKDGQLELDKMITKTYSIDEAPEAFRALDAGENARGVIVFK